MSYDLSHYQLVLVHFYNINIRVYLSIYFTMHCHCCCACVYCAFALFSRFGYKFNKHLLLSYTM